MKQEKEVIVIDAEVIESDTNTGIVKKIHPLLKRNKYNKILSFFFIIFSFIAMILMCTSNLAYEIWPNTYYDSPFVINDVFCGLTITMLITVVISLFVNVMYLVNYKKVKPVFHIVLYVSSFIASAMMMVCAIFYMTYGGNRSTDDQVVSALVFTVLSTAVIFLPTIRILVYLFNRYMMDFFLND